MTATAAFTLLGLLGTFASSCSSGNPAPETSPAPSRPEARTGAAAATVQEESMDRTPRESLEKALEGRVAGVVVRHTSEGGIAVVIRGKSDPLYILDGVPYQPGTNGTLIGINPNDIESIRVLKDPTDIAMYGTRGTNGVIVIKTKRGRQSP